MYIRFSGDSVYLYGHDEKERALRDLKALTDANNDDIDDGYAVSGRPVLLYIPTGNRKAVSSGYIKGGNHRISRYWYDTNGELRKKLIGGDTWL